MFCPVLAQKLLLWQLSIDFKKEDRRTLSEGVYALKAKDMNRFKRLESEDIFKIAFYSMFPALPENTVKRYDNKIVPQPQTDSIIWN